MHRPLRARLAASLPLALLLAPAGAATEWFHAPRIYPEAEDGAFHLQGDLDGDADVDLVSFRRVPGEQGSLGFRVFENDGAGDLTAKPFVAFAPTVGIQFVGRLSPRSGDVDGDGRIDLIVERFSGFGNPNPSGLHVYRGDGAGGFLPDVFVPLPAGPSWYALGQADADPALEIAVTGGDSLTHALRWVDHVGGGVFQVSAPFFLGTGDPLLGLSRFVAVDVDGDGDDDVVGPNSPETLLRAILTQGGAPAAAGPTWTLPGPLVNQNTIPVAGDVDGDGDRDVLLVRLDNFGSDVWLQAFRATPGGLLQDPLQSVVLPGGVNSGDEALTLADWDVDGDLDLYTGTAVASLLENRGAFQFRFGCAMWLGGIGWSDCGPADLDGDGLLDAVGPESTLRNPGGFVDHQFGIGTGPTPGFADRAVEDADGDGDLDLTGGALAGYDRNDATGVYTSTGSRLPALTPPLAWSQIVARGDVTGDGRPDWIVAKLKVQAFPLPNVQLGAFLLAEDAGGKLVEVKQVLPAGAEPFGGPVSGVTWPLADADSDGDVDILVKDGFLPNDGTHSFGAPVAAFVGMPLAAADVDLDGDADLLVEQASPHLFKIERKQPGGYVSEVLPIPVATSVITRARFVDLDLDGDPDLLAGDELGSVSPALDGTVRPFENVAGAFVARPALLGTISLGPLVAAGDVDGDGVLDLLVQRLKNAIGQESAVAVHRGLGGFEFERPRLYRVNGLRMLADGDGDGDVDAHGGFTIDGLAVDGPEAGSIRQYGTGAPGSAGAVPLLGAQGPMATGSVGAHVRARRMLGGAPAFLVVGLSEAAIGGTPFPGLKLLVGPPAWVLPVVAAGPAGAAAEGGFDLPIVTDGSVAGLDVFLQVYVADPGAATGGLANSNGLELVHGI